MKRTARRTVIGLTAILATQVGVAAPAQATHTYNHSCSYGTSQVPTTYKNATNDGSYVSASGRIYCHEGNPYDPGEQVTELYINLTLQIQSAVTGSWISRDSGSARWTGLIGNTPPTVTAYASDVCANTAYRKHRIRYNEVWYRTGDGGVHYLSQGSYSGSQPYLYCGV